MLKRIKHHWITSQKKAKGAAVSSHSAQPGARHVPRMAVAELIGAPDDRGVFNVGGRLGAGGGPEAIRELLSQYVLGIDGAIGRIELHEGFDIDLGPSIGAAHTALRKAAASALKRGITPVILGGGHDYGYPQAAGAFDAFKGRIAIINIDAHLDLRPPAAEGVTSGSPFYLALEEEIVDPKNLVEFGIQEHCNDESFYRYAQRKGVRILMLDQVRTGGGPVKQLAKLIRGFALKGLKVVVSFDLDSVASAYAPAVSEPQSDGFNPAEFLGMAGLCGESRSVATAGFFELAPSLDENRRTTKLAATAVHRFLCGLSRRHGVLFRRNAGFFIPRRR